MVALIRDVLHGKNKDREAPQFVVDTRDVNAVVELFSDKVDSLVESKKVFKRNN